MIKIRNELRFFFSLGPFLFVTLFLGSVCSSYGKEAPLSPQTEECISCHSNVTPTMVADWKRSRHSKITVADALKKSDLQKIISAEKIPEKYLGFAVGCAECHSMNPDSHKDTFDHGDQKVHLTVSPRDCSKCHSQEAAQYEKNLMSHARVNLVNNKLYGTMIESINGLQTFRDGKTNLVAPDEKTNADSCYQCHGTAVEVKGKQTRDTDAGEMEFLVLDGWPNQGVGRFNPDGSKGSCSSCHNRHQFAIQMARKPYACSKCHKGPDVPAYQAYSVSKHGNLFSALWNEWNFTEVPWKIGQDFIAPTCATCHVSLLASTNGDILAKRTHQMNDRLPWRILGLIYAHPHSKSPDTSIIRNKDNQQLPTTLKGEMASDYLINRQEQGERQHAMQAVCRSCHTAEWVKGHWDRFENSIKTTNEMTLTATQIVEKAWQDKVADNKLMFDEAIEKQWVEQWLFYANSTRFASAMMGADFGVFANGRWYMAKNIQEMIDRLKFLLNAKEKASSIGTK